MSWCFFFGRPRVRFLAGRSAILIVIRLSPSEQILDSTLYLLGLRGVDIVLFSTFLKTALMKNVCFLTASIYRPRLDWA
jgi:hypothetical protein